MNPTPNAHKLQGDAAIADDCHASGVLEVRRQLLDRVGVSQGEDLPGKPGGHAGQLHGSGTSRHA